MFTFYEGLASAQVCAHRDSCNLRVLLKYKCLYLLKGLASAQVCTHRGDGVYDAGCRGYTVCKNGTGTVVLCTAPQVFNKATNGCDDPANVKEICGRKRDCNTMDTMRFADVDRKCLYYYTCFAGKFMGHTPCPFGTVFNYDLQVCDFIVNVPSPCGLKPAPTVHV
ncbi:hypothetical protein FSP39_025513 [Pinctada imbricata]|uniref:Chitin-binding type-2 domain-containing protein n=1 Tax=Pinctada imbricata TaxID=66713 RepID=A0AA89BN57_PINIB|nr:hypothetical protein FSP39_025513 [Pinctada imbricata]